MFGRSDDRCVSSLPEPGGMRTGRISLARPNHLGPCAALHRQRWRAWLARILRCRPPPSFSKVPFRAGTWCSICHFRECRVDIVIVRRCPCFVRTALHCRSNDAIPRHIASSVCATKISHSAQAKECPKLQKSGLIAGRLHLPMAMGATAWPPVFRGGAFTQRQMRTKVTRRSSIEWVERPVQKGSWRNCHALETPPVLLLWRSCFTCASG